MGIQTIIDTAQQIEYVRGQLVASTMSRSGRLLTSTRNWAKPWVFTITPKPIFRFADFRGELEEILAGDRTTTYTISLNNNTKMNWLTAYQGAGVINDFIIDNTTNVVSSILKLQLGTGNSALTAGTILFKAGDIIQPQGHNYPYVVTSQVLKPVGATSSTTVINVPLNRGLLPQTSYTLAGHHIQAGINCTWPVKVTKLPTVVFASKDFVQFRGDFELTEFIESVS